MAFYPLPSLIAFIGWAFIFATAGGWYVAGASAALFLGVIAYLVWSRWWCAAPSVADSLLPAGETAD